MVLPQNELSLQALIKHPHRVNLDNEPVEAITDEEKTAAQQQLERYDEIRKQAEQKEVPVVVKTESVSVDTPKKLTLKIKKAEPTAIVLCIFSDVATAKTCAKSPFFGVEMSQMQELDTQITHGVLAYLRLNI